MFFLPGSTRPKFPSKTIKLAEKSWNPEKSLFFENVPLSHKSFPVPWEVRYNLLLGCYYRSAYPVISDPGGGQGCSGWRGKVFKECDNFPSRKTGRGQLGDKGQQEFRAARNLARISRVGNKRSAYHCPITVSSRVWGTVEVLVLIVSPDQPIAQRVWRRLKNAGSLKV